MIRTGLAGKSCACARAVRATVATAAAPAAKRKRLRRGRLMEAVFYHVRPRYRERSPPIAVAFQSPQRLTRVVFLHTAFDVVRRRGGGIASTSCLRATAMMAAGFALPPARAFAQSKISPPMQTLSAYMAAAGSRPLPDEVAEHAKHHLIDTLASMVSGSELLPGQAAQRYVRAHGGKGAATIAGTMLTAAPADAALANGVMAHADETDDSHNASRSHPGCAIVPAALAVAEEVGIDGTRFLRAVTLGYDIGTRVVLAMGGAEFSYESSLATHSIAGTFGAAAAAACAAGLDARQMRWALDYTAQQSSGIVAWRRDSDHIEKAFVFGGMTARNGVASALLVRSGWNGIDDIF